MNETLGSLPVARPPEFIIHRLLKVKVDLRGRVKAVSSVVAFAATETNDASNSGSRQCCPKYTFP